MNSIYASRRRNDIIVRFLCIAAALFGVSWLASILFTLFYNGLAGISVQLFTQNTPPPGSTEGGLLNAIVGSIIMTVIGGVMLALGRALGETMAVTFIIGNSFRISTSIFGPGTTISAAIASEFAESDGLHQSGLILLGLLLFVLTFFVLSAARLMLLHLEKKAGN